MNWPDRAPDSGLTVSRLSGRVLPYGPGYRPLHRLLSLFRLGCWSSSPRNPRLVNEGVTTLRSRTRCFLPSGPCRPLLYGAECLTYPLFLMVKTRAGPLPVRLRTRLANPAFAKCVCASSTEIPYNLETRLTNSTSISVIAVSGPLFILLKAPLQALLSSCSGCSNKLRFGA